MFIVAIFIGGGIGGAGGASAPPLLSEKAVNIINTYTFILGAKYISPPHFLHASSTPDIIVFYIG